MTLSPCISKCALTKTREYCISCGRTLEDIRAWKNMDEFAKGFSVLEAKIRLRLHNPQ